ncbi:MULTISPECIES: M48 family metallopeptidase [Burkholderia]|uniref:M48 family metallopeptidase n=1 Tax=Burkholderia TaxID=32008 RepID=UPI0008422911|nr:MULTISPECIES: SprT family zinc-dependent metalloprotease [Burkholderia]AOK11636.1 metal-dependent hydrolase [Burkholderia vietnamiensis]MBR8356879.1 M48 family metallopeptidase [Burkholderia vietnamiensis]MCA7943710.1 M48 family metallopeptidase [Burkholderia vietnamiensis]MDN8076196.1 SprT family zinc-dependent metalloprotease [Burkholderia vietnamiensis]RQM52389.1 M48 family peptidase [Burkholderia vietnamiensis]
MKKRPRPRPAVVALDHRQMDLPLFDGPTAASPAPATPATPAPAAAPPATPAAGAPAAPLDPGPARDRSRVRTFAIDSRVLEYRLKRSARRTIGFTIDGSGLSITAPRWVTLTDIEAAIAEKQRWIFAKLAEWKTRTEQRALPQIDWRDGAQLPYLGKTVTIALGASAVAFDTDTLRLSLPLPAQADMQQIKDRVQGWLQGEAKRIFGERLAVYAQRLGVTYSTYALSSAATRWGSCSSDGRIRLNWRLIHFPMSIIDYVVAHELSHLREMNHSPAFWQTVESIFPEFREARHTLKHHPPELLPSL